MRLVSDFPADTIISSVFIDMNSDALLCLLVPVKEIIRPNCHLYYHRQHQARAVITLQELCFVGKLKFNQSADENLNQRWVIWLKNIRGCHEKRQKISAHQKERRLEWLCDIERKKGKQRKREKLLLYRAASLLKVTKYNTHTGANKG